MPSAAFSPHPYLFVCLSFWSQSDLLIGPIHEGFDPAGSVDKLGGGDDVLRSTVLHLREEPQGGDLRIGHSPQEEHQRGSVLSLLAWGADIRTQNDDYAGETPRHIGVWLTTPVSSMAMLLNTPL